MQKIKFYYANHHENSGSWGGCHDQELGPFTNKRAANKALRIMVEKVCDDYAKRFNGTGYPNENSKVEFRFKDQEDWIVYAEDFRKRFMETFKKGGNGILYRWDLEEHKFDHYCFEISFKVREGEIPIYDTVDEVKANPGLKNDMDYCNFFANATYLKD